MKVFFRLIRTIFKINHELESINEKLEFMLDHKAPHQGASTEKWLDGQDVMQKLHISERTLLRAAVESTEPEKVVFNWTDNTDSGTAKAADKAILLLYNPEQGQYVFVTDGGLRSARTGTVAVPADFSGDSLEAWMTFVSEDGQSVSTSIYVGTIRVA